MMKVTLTKASLAPESSAPDTITLDDVQKSSTVGELMENAMKQKPFGDDIKDYEVHHIGFHLTRHFTLVDLKQDTIHLHLVKPVPDSEAIELQLDNEDELARDQIPAATFQAKFYIICNAKLENKDHSVVTIPANKNETIDLIPYKRDNDMGEEFWFGVSTRAEVTKSLRAKPKYEYALYNFDKNPDNQGYAIKLRLEDKQKKVVLAEKINGKWVERILEPNDTYIPLAHHSEEDKFKNVKRLFGTLTKEGAKGGAKGAAEQGAEEIVEVIVDQCCVIS